MNKSITALLLVACIFLLYSQFSELAYRFGFAELKLVAVLENSEKMKVKCDAYSLGFFDEIKLQNKYQKCINDYEEQGFTLISRSDS